MAALSLTKMEKYFSSLNTRAVIMGTENMDSMLEISAEAIQSKNFELSKGIYEYQILRFSDPVIQQELLVKRADALAFDGKLSEAFETYQKASEFYRLRPVQLENLIQCLSGRLRRIERLDSQNNHYVVAVTERSGYDTFACGICFGFLYEPVTLLCGHCFCKKCLESERKTVCCKGCKDHSKVTEPHNYRVNVVLSNLLAKWFPSQLNAVKLRREGNGLYAEKRLEDALGKYNEAIHIAPKDHVLYANRSQINSSLKKFEDALSDADMACKLKPLWAKGHIRKAQVLTAMGKRKEALTEYLLSITLDHESELAKTEAQKLLSDLLIPVRNCLRKKILDCTTLQSSRTRLLSSSLIPHGPIMLQRSYKDYKIYINNIVAQSGSSRAFSSTEDCSKYRFDTEEPASVTGQGLLCKRKLSAEDDGKTTTGDGAYKRYKLGDEQKKVDTGRCRMITDLIDPGDLECSLCIRLFYEPVTTPCGHTFCLKCLERCLDHNPSCPLCKEDLSEYLAQRQYCKTILMEDIISKYLPAELTDRQKVYEEEIAELSNLNKNVPIFVCTMAFPTVPCPLHIFEPCYRLMIRRFADYGCMLEIRNVELFADGCSVVDTIGRRRFRVIQHSQRDGYNTADIEYLEDIKVAGDAETELRMLHDVVYDQALDWVNSLQAEQKQRIESHFGPMPEKDLEPQGSPNGPSWCWWLLAVLPLEGRAQLSFLALTSLKDRLTGIRRVLVLMSRSHST
ncbi:LON peptidase N-terminal domain and RING finger protein 3-like isoform X2 [Electrophorus electricus]|uniref:LON peptidase N-terminal domain and RING finger protein 3-like isoform X2 n=1 Tax=Electrophorus electricus TaxID=8005 RepID=UPI0015CF9638|nr:LON peptidase N-terminal domain and RING finger protein 3-like isoform X2 [Electrophorus electricus]